MNETKMKELLEKGFDEKWLKNIQENLIPKENGKYEIHIYDCEDLDQEPDTGLFIASYFFDNEYDLTAIHYFFEGFFYVMRVVETQKELGRGIVDGAPFDEMEEYEGKPWEWLDYSSLGSELHEKREKEKEELENLNSSLKEDEKFLEDLIERNFNEIFFEYQERKGIQNGDISPMNTLELDDLKEKLKKLIQEVCC